MERWWERIRGLLFWRRVDKEVADEMRFHLDMEIAARIREGMSPGEAHRTAHADFGGLERYREQAREARWGHPVETGIRDCRYALRSLARAPGFTLAALLSLALGIGANTAVFSVVRSVLLRPLPYEDADRVVLVQQSWTTTPTTRLSPAEFLDYQSRLDGFDAFGVLAYDAFELVGDGDPTMVRGGWLSPGAMAALGVTPTRGRLFTEDDVRADAQVAVISDAFWRDRLGEGEDAIGSSISLNGRSVEVIGIMPPEFRLPRYVLSGLQGHVYRPLGYDPEQITIRGSHFLIGLARLGASMSVAEGSAAVAEVTDWMARTFPDDYPAEARFTGRVTPLADVLRGPVRRPLGVLMAAVGLVLLVAVGNVANLLLARTDSRAGELALRAVLGAGRGRLVAQALAESLLLALGGGALGVGIAYVASDAVETYAPVGLGWLSEVTVDGAVLGFSLGISLLTGLIFGLVPLWSGQVDRSRDLLHGGSARTSGTRGGFRARTMLIAAEMALAVVLLTGAGLLTRSFSRLTAVDPGYRTDGLVTASLALPSARYPDNDAIVAFYRDLIPALESIPGVTAAGAVTNLPLATFLGDMGFQIEGRPVPEGSASPAADWQAVTPGYFDAMEIRPVRGRLLGRSDDAGSVGAVVINQTFARNHWPEGDPLGQRLELGGGAGPRWVTVVGIVPDVRHGGLDQGGRSQMYLSHEQFRYWGSGSAVPWMTLVLATPLAPAELRPQIVDRVASFDPALPLTSFRTMADVRSRSVALPRLMMGLMMAFAVVALLLAAVGVYGLTSYSVGRRTRELGIRIALGAQPHEVTGLVVGQGIRLALAGAAVGVVAAAASGRVLASLLYEIDPLDPVTLIGVPLFLGAVAVLACLAPARRALRVDPVTSLRAE